MQQHIKACPPWRVATIVAEIGDNLSPNLATVAVFGDSRRIRRQIVVVSGDYSRQCLQGFSTNERRVRKRDKTVRRDVI